MSYVPQGSPYSSQTKLVAAQNNAYPQQQQQAGYNSPGGGWGYDKTSASVPQSKQHFQQQPQTSPVKQPPVQQQSSVFPEYDSTTVAPPYKEEMQESKDIVKTEPQTNSTPTVALASTQSVLMMEQLKVEPIDPPKSKASQANHRYWKRLICKSVNLITFLIS